MKDNLVTVDLLGPKSKVQQKDKTYRLIGGKLIPGEQLTLRKDRYGSPNLRMRFLARCLRSGVLLCERA